MATPANIAATTTAHLLAMFAQCLRAAAFAKSNLS